MSLEPVNCLLVASGKYHDIDYARAQILSLLAEYPIFRTLVRDDYEDLEALNRSDVLISYTCDVIPSIESQNALKNWLNAGGRWLALHGTNSILKMMDDGLWHTPRQAPIFMELLGSQFLSHPPIAPYTVRNVYPSHALVKNIDDFQVKDELYHLELYGDLEVYLEADCNEPGRGFAEGDSAIGKHPVFYSKRHGNGAVLYLTLGHCRGHFDLRPFKDFLPELDRGCWDQKEFQALLSRSILWLHKQS